MWIHVYKYISISGGVTLDGSSYRRLSPVQEPAI